MNAYLIDPEAQTVEAVEWDGNWQSIAPMIDASLFDAVEFNAAGDVCFVDDEGLMKRNALFQIKGYPQPLAGKALVLGTDLDSGESIEPAESLERVRERVAFVAPVQFSGGVDFVVIALPQ